MKVDGDWLLKKFSEAKDEFDWVKDAGAICSPLQEILPLKRRKKERSAVTESCPNSKPELLDYSGKWDA